MRINEEYYIENVYTLIRVPNGVTSQVAHEFASRYFCLQSDSTHNVYIVWKRRNRVKRVDQLDRKSIPKLLFKPEIDELHESTSETCLLRSPAPQSKFKLFRPLLCRPKIKLNSIAPIDKLSNDSQVHSLNSVPTKPTKLFAIKSNNKAYNLIKPSSSYSFTFKISTFKFKKLRSPFKIEQSVLNQSNDKCRSPNNLRKGKLFKVIKNKLKSLNAKVQDKSCDSAKVLKIDESSKPDAACYQKIDESWKPACYQKIDDDEITCRTNCLESKSPNKQDAKLDKHDDRILVENKKKSISKLFSRLSKQVSGGTSLIQTLRSSKEDFKRTKVAKKFRSVFKNIHHNFVDLIAGTSDKC